MRRISARLVVRLAPLLSRAVPAFALALTGSAVQAANWFVETGVRGEVTATDNALMQSNVNGSSDVVFALTPTLVIRGEGARLRMGGTFAMSAINYASGSQESAVVPNGALTANLEAIERWFFIEAGLSASRGLVNPLSPRPEGPSTLNRATISTARISPYIDRALPNDIRLVLRSDNAWTETRGETERPESIYAVRHSVRVSREPQPFGWSIEGDRRDETREGELDGVPAIDVARASFRYAFGGQVALGVRGGYERSDAFVGGEARSIAGAELSWRPTERTRLEGFWEDRSFGDGYLASFDHRSPFVAWNLRASRELTSFADSAIELPATGDLTALLDAALRTRIVDPIERARAVENFISQRGLPRTLTGPVSVYSEQLFVLNARSGTITFIGTRSTLALNGFYRRETTPQGSSFAILTGPGRNLAQDGASLAYSLRLNSVASAVASAGYARTQDVEGTAGLQPGAPGSSRQQTYRLQYDYQLAPRSNGFFGVRFQRFESDVVDNARETAVFAGLGHRF